MQRSLSLVPVVVWLSSCNFIERYRHELAQIVVTAATEAVKNQISGNGAAAPAPTPVEAVSAQLLTHRAMKARGAERQALLAQAAAADPRAAMPHVLLGIEQQRQRQWGAAIQSYVTALGIDQANPVVQFNLAAAYAVSGQRQEARAHLDEAFQQVASDAGTPPVVRHAVRAAAAFQRVQQVRHDRAAVVEQATRAASEIVRELLPSADVGDPGQTDALGGLALAADALLSRGSPRDERAVRLLQAAGKIAGVRLLDAPASELQQGVVVLAMDLLRLALPGLDGAPAPVAETLTTWVPGLDEPQALALAEDLTAAAAPPEPLRPDLDFAQRMDGVWWLCDGDGVSAELELVDLDGDVIVRTRDLARVELARVVDGQLELEWAEPLPDGGEIRWRGRCAFAPDRNSAQLTGERVVRGADFVAVTPVCAALLRVGNPPAAAIPLPVGEPQPVDGAELRPVLVPIADQVRILAYEPGPGH